MGHVQGLVRAVSPMIWEHSMEPRPIHPTVDVLRALGAGKLADARRFQRGTPIFGKALTAAELKQQLAL